jgi:hypothetical protein
MFKMGNIIAQHKIGIVILFQNDFILLILYFTVITVFGKYWWILHHQWRV